MDSAEGFTINSFVFVDLETSHLESCERPKIIEMSLFAVHRTGLLHPAVLSSINGARREDATYDLSKVSLPRVVDKLTLCLDPRKQTSAQTFWLTGLDNLNLGESKKMSLDEDTISMLNIFLKRQEGPVCLVAHNGKRFDFPMLRTELSRLTAKEHTHYTKVLQESSRLKEADCTEEEAEEKVFEDLFCADSLEGFRANFATETEVKQDEDPLSLKRKMPECDISTGWPCSEKRGTNLSNNSTYGEGRLTVSVSAAAVTGSNETSMNCPTIFASSPHGSTLSSSIQPQTSEDLGASTQPSIPTLDPISLHITTTTTTCITTTTTTTEYNPSTSSDNTPERTLTKRPSPPPPPRKTNRPYHTKSPKISYSLINIFKRTFGREPPNSHSAEDDVASLIKVLLPRVEEFVNWADVHAVQYKDIGLYYKPLKPRRKLFDD